MCPVIDRLNGHEQISLVDLETASAVIKDQILKHNDDFESFKDVFDLVERWKENLATLDKSAKSNANRIKDICKELVYFFEIINAGFVESTFLFDMSPYIPVIQIYRSVMEEIEREAEGLLVKPDSADVDRTSAVLNISVWLCDLHEVSIHHKYL